MWSRKLPVSCYGLNVRIEQPRKFPVGVIAQFPDDKRVFADAHQQQRIGREFHDFVGVHQIAGGEVLGFRMAAVLALLNQEKDRRAKAQDTERDAPGRGR